MATDSIRALLDEARLSLDDIAERVGVTRGAVNLWHKGKSRPAASRRAALVEAMREHANTLLRLADRVEAEGGALRQRPKVDAAPAAPAERFADWNEHTVVIEHPTEKPKHRKPQRRR
jgi:transcriptional regulator with XRE-family HTH domain